MVWLWVCLSGWEKENQERGEELVSHFFSLLTCSGVIRLGFEIRKEIERGEKTTAKRQRKEGVTPSRLAGQRGDESVAHVVLEDLGDGLEGVPVVDDGAHAK